MKRAISVVLVFIMVLSLCTSAFASEITDHPYGYGPEDGYVAQLNKVELTIDSDTRSYYEYVARAYQTATPVVYIFTPGNTNISDFLVSSGWKATADAAGIALIFPLPENGEWDIKNGDLDYWKKVSTVVPQNTRNHNTRIYLVGYGDGAQMAQVALLEQHQVFGGAAFIDCNDMDSALLKEFGDVESNGWKSYSDKLSSNVPTCAKDVEQNVLFLTRNSASLNNSIAFWKNAASASNTATRISADTVSYIGTENDAAAVTIKTIGADEVSGKSWSDAVWQHLNQTRRYRNSPNSSLAHSFEWQDDENATLKTMQVEGRTREWVEVLPSDYDSNQSYPVVLALHGSNNDGPQMYELTRLAEVAEARKFIVLFPTGSRTESAYDLWDYKFETDDSNGRQDIEYLLALLDYYKDNYAVEASRIYVTGFSNGGSMTNALAMRHAELFAAAMPYSGAVPDEYYPEITDDTLNIPVWMNKGTLETVSQSIGNYGDEQVAYWTERNGIDMNNYVVEQEGVFATKTYAADTAFLWTDRIDGAHAIFAENYWDIYDDFFAHCQRGENGESIWNDYVVTLKANGKSATISNAKRIDGVVYLPLTALNTIGAKATLTVNGTTIIDTEDGIYADADTMFAAAGMTAAVTVQPKGAVVTVADGYSDVSKNDWFYADVVSISEAGLMSGTGNGKFSPNLDTTRAMVVTMLYRLAGEPAVSVSGAFSDVDKNAYYAKAVAWAEINGIAAGMGDGSFAPNAAVTREQLAAFLYNYAKMSGYDMSKSDNLKSFSDAPSTWAVPAMQWAVGNGLVNGMGDNTLQPNGTATRAQLAAIFVRFGDTFTR